MKFYIYNLGCKVNSYESNVMKDNLINNGFVLSSLDDADIVVINSCCVTNTASNKTMKLIRHVYNNYSVILVVVGCFVQSRKENLSDIPGDILIGNKNKSMISSYIKKFLDTRERIEDLYDVSDVSFETMKLNNYDHTRAFIKIQDGCNNFCSYCIIPFTRGGVRSKKKEDVLSEVRDLISSGHKEIVLTGIHTGNYGVEFDNYDFASLGKKISVAFGFTKERFFDEDVNYDDTNTAVLPDDVIKNEANRSNANNANNG